MTSQDDPFAVFRPRRGRIVAIVLAVAAIAVFGFVAVFIADTAAVQWGAADRLFLGSLGWLLAAVFWRYATIRAVPSREGLLVRNLFTTRRLVWPQVLSVQFGHGMPWPTLELDDFDTIAVMAIQRSDGKRSEAEASRLAALVKALGEAVEQ
ncbi:MAG: PH domain-containing protein [Dermatophilaceae bacterium]